MMLLLSLDEITLKLGCGKSGLLELLQSAVALELATIPVYLTGAFSVKHGHNAEALALVQSVVYEEMLHMSLACNLLNAVGGTPQIKAAGQSLHFPGRLPGTVEESLTVNLRALTHRQAHDVFMGIERPDTTAFLPGEDTKPQNRKPPGYASIGDFYQAIQKKLLENQEWIDPSNTKHQINVSRYFPPCLAGTGIVTDYTTAALAIQTIIMQGEGFQTGADPIDPYGGMNESFAHYFKFGEIYYGKRLVMSPAALSGWAYAGQTVVLDPDGIHDFVENAALSDYAPGSGAEIAGKEFYAAYIRLLTALDQVFNGASQRMDGAIAIMFELKLAAQKVALHKVGTKTAAPPFQRTHH